MHDYILSPRAKEDFVEIWEYTAITWSPKQADLYFDQLMIGINHIRLHSFIGRSIDEMYSGYRIHPCQSHLLIYKIDNNTIDVIRILHQSMDVITNLK